MWMRAVGKGGVNGLEREKERTRKEQAARRSERRTGKRDGNEREKCSSKSGRETEKKWGNAQKRGEIEQMGAPSWMVRGREWSQRPRRSSRAQSQSQLQSQLQRQPQRQVSHWSACAAAGACAASVLPA